ncbi:MAG TPA: LysR family transcriptional regulator, partial [Sphingomonas sp.]|nr:LysR family transcriptional regulator [Sphingomonas sp.]
MDNTAAIAASLSFRQLKLFESVGRLNSVRKASEECNLSQPAVTQSLAKLEQQIGVALLERRASGSYLNELGEIFHRRTTRLFDLIERALVDLGVPGGDHAAPVIARRISRSQARSLIA